MNTLKNAALLMVMGGVLYFVYITLNKPPAAPGSSNVDLQAEALAPPDLQIETGTPTTEVPSAPPLAAFSTPIPNRGSQWQKDETTPANTAPDMEPVVPSQPSPGSAYAVQPPDAGASSANYEVVTEEQPAPRAGGWSSDRNAGPPVAPEIVEYPAPSTPTYSDTPDEPASSYAVVTPPAETAPEVNPQVQQLVYTESSAASTPNGAALVAYTVKQKFAQANAAIEGNRFREALVCLTELYKRNDLAPSDRAVLLQWIDALAGKVIYSSEHTLAEPYKVTQGEDLLTISQRMQVPWQLLQKINNVTNPQVVVPQSQLKVVPGPFNADLDLATNEMTLYLKDMYAGRFAFTLGDEAPRPGQYQVRDKSKDRPYYGRDGRMIPARDPSNPYGGWWIDLGSGASLHGSPTTASINQQGHGCVSFSPKDAEDIFSILSVGSAVTIR